MIESKDYKKEIENLINHKNELEKKISNSQGQRDLLLRQLKEDHNITEEQIDEKIKELLKIVSDAEIEMDKQIAQMKEYIIKLEGIING